MGSEIIGWLSSLLLLLTLTKQIHTQWKEKTSRGVSKWLYLGQFAAEVGFVVYAWLLKNWVFFATNLGLLVLNIVGLVITLQQRQRQRQKQNKGTDKPSAVQ